MSKKPTPQANKRYTTDVDLRSELTNFCIEL